MVMGWCTRGLSGPRPNGYHIRNQSWGCLPRSARLIHMLSFFITAILHAVWCHIHMYIYIYGHITTCMVKINDHIILTSFTVCFIPSRGAGTVVTIHKISTRRWVSTRGTGAFVNICLRGKRHWSKPMVSVAVFTVASLTYDIFLPQ